MNYTISKGPGSPEATGKDSLQVQDSGKVAALEVENRERELNAFVRLVLGDEATLTPSGNVVLAVARLKKDLEELARLRAGGCARDQRTTQFCAEAVELEAKLDKEREYSRGLEEAGDLLAETSTTPAIERWTAAKEAKP